MTSLSHSFHSILFYYSTSHEQFILSLCGSLVAIPTAKKYYRSFKRLLRPITGFFGSGGSSSRREDPLQTRFGPAGAGRSGGSGPDSSASRLEQGTTTSAPPPSSATTTFKSEQQLGLKAVVLFSGQRAVACPKLKHHNIIEWNQAISLPFKALPVFNYTYSCLPIQWTVYEYTSQPEAHLFLIMLTIREIYTRTVCFLQVSYILLPSVLQCPRSLSSTFETSMFGTSNR